MNKKLDLSFPIGTIYFSLGGTNPTEFIGGEWEVYTETNNGIYYLRTK